MYIWLLDFFLGGGPPARQLSQVAEIVFDILGQSEVSITGLRGGIDSSMMQAIEMQQRQDISVFIYQQAGKQNIKNSFYSLHMPVLISRASFY